MVASRRGDNIRVAQGALPNRGTEDRDGEQVGAGDPVGGPTRGYGRAGPVASPPETQRCDH